MQEADEAVLLARELFVHPRAMQSKLVDRADVRQRILRENEARPAVNRAGGFHGDQAVVLRIDLSQNGKPVRLGGLLALGVDLPGVAILIAAPADVIQLVYAALADRAEVYFAG